MNDNMTALVPLAETMELGQILAKSRFFADATEAAQAVVKVLAGREIGAGPIASMVGIHIIKGKPAIGATLMAGVIRNSKRYDYRIRKHDDTLCEIEFFMRNGSQLESLGVSAFSIEDAKRAGTQNIDKFPRNMLFARAMSNGAKWFCPDIFGGAPVYTPEELGASVDGDGDVIEGSVRVVQPEPQPVQPTVTQAAPPPKPNGTHNTPQPPTDEEAEALFEQMQSAQAERQPAPAKTNGDGKLKPAGLDGKPAGWDAACVALAEKFPKYRQKDGTPNRYHILMSAAAEGITLITNDNLDAVMDAIEQRAARDA